MLQQGSGWGFRLPCGALSELRCWAPCSLVSRDGMDCCNFDPISNGPPVSSSTTRRRHPPPPPAAPRRRRLHFFEFFFEFFEL